MKLPPVPEAPILILNWNGWDDTFECLASIYADDPEHTVWVVDNGSVEDRGAELLAKWPQVRLIRNGENLGFAGGCNTGLRLALEEGLPFIYLLNNDAAVEPGFLKVVLETARSGPKVGAVGSLIVSFDGTQVQFDGSFHPNGSMPERGNAATAREVRDACGAGLLFNIAALREVGVFDERFFCYGEETDLCRRLGAAGWRILYDHRSAVRHKDSGSDVSDNRLYYTARNELLLLQNHTPPELLRKYLLYAIGHFMVVAGQKAKPQRELMMAALHDGMARRFGKRPDLPAKSARPKLLWHLYQYRRLIELKMLPRGHIKNLPSRILAKR